MRELIIAPEALQDLNSIADYFVDRNVEAGEFLFQRFNQRCKQLANFPLSGKSYSHLRLGLRGINFEGYIIFYRVNDEELVILRVVSGRQNLSKIFSDDA